MKIVRQAVGAVTIEWDDGHPLRWTMTETIGKGRNAESTSYPINLTELRNGFTEKFLTALKDACIARAYRVRMPTIATEIYRIQKALEAALTKLAQAQDIQLFPRIDTDLLSGLWAIKDNIPSHYLRTFRSFYIRNRDNLEIFATDLHKGDFPTRADGETFGTRSKIRQSILASALKRATLVHILNITEAAFGEGQLKLSTFAFSRLLLSRAARPESFRLLRVKDLIIDINGGQKTYFLNFTIPKARTHERPTAKVRIHRDVGAVLERQREDVVRQFGHLVEARNTDRVCDSEDAHNAFTVGDLALFPVNNYRIRQSTKTRLGMIRTASSFTKTYVDPLKELCATRITCTAIRHTMGTQLAVAGCSTNTIAAILLHANESSARVYVDLAFSEAIDEISNSLEPAFSEHFPVFRDFVKSTDVISQAKRIVSPSRDGEYRQTTGECGRVEICQYAPIACYECVRFRPCYDVDHSINLDRVQWEIELASQGGLPRKVDVARYSHIANRIRAVMYVCDAKRAEIEFKPAIDRQIQ